MSRLDRVVRYRKGATALMSVVSYDDLCGYRTYHGIHLFGETISFPADNCKEADENDHALWKKHAASRLQHKRTLYGI